MRWRTFVLAMSSIILNFMGSLPGCIAAITRQNRSPLSIIINIRFLLLNLSFVQSDAIRQKVA